MPTETLHIQNFAGIKDAEISLARFNLFIGPQASGKSVTAKLFYFFKQIIENLEYSVWNNADLENLSTVIHYDFVKYFPSVTWGQGHFAIRYSCGEFSVCVTHPENEQNALIVTYSSYFKDFLEASVHWKKEWQKAPLTPDFLPNFLEKYRIFKEQRILADLSPTLTKRNFFIPAGRSFFSSIQRNVFRLSALDITIDPFITQFGRTYEYYRDVYENVRSDIRIEQLNPYVTKIIRGEYVRENNLDYIHTSDGRYVPISLCSSGQQEALPLALFLAAAGTESPTFFIEEPEAHIYPSTQRDIIHLLATAANTPSSVPNSEYNQYLITTHSPYILSALNNLMYAGQIAEKFPERKAQVAQVIDDAAPITPGQVQAYMMQDGHAESIIDPETGLVRATLLDEVSGDLAQEFEQLMDIEFKEE